MDKKNRKDGLLKGVEEIDRNFKYVKNKANENNLKQRIRYRLPKHETIDQLEILFVFGLETYNDLDFAEAYAAGFYDVNRLRDKMDSYLSVQETETERENVIVFDKSCGNTIMNLLKFISENYEGDETTYIDKNGNEIVSSYGLSLVAHNSSGFDSWVVLKSLVEEIIESILLKNR